MIGLLVVAVLVAFMAPSTSALPQPQENMEEPDSLLNNLQNNLEDSKPFNLQGVQSGRRAHGIYFNG